jgi:hypothetical protein
MQLLADEVIEWKWERKAAVVCPLRASLRISLEVLAPYRIYWRKAGFLNEGSSDETCAPAIPALGSR